MGDHGFSEVQPELVRGVVLCGGVSPESTYFFFGSDDVIWALLTLMCLSHKGGVWGRDKNKMVHIK